MKKTLPIVALFALIAISCQTIQPYLTDAGIISAVSVATVTGLRVIDPSKRTAVANFVDLYAAAARRVSTAPDPAAFIAELNKYVPQEYRDKYPELLSFVNPIIVQAYSVAYTKYQGNLTQMYRVITDIATGLEAGAAPYISH